MNEQTLALIKPDAVGRNLIGEVIRRWEKSGLHIVAIKMVRLTLKEAEAFYQVHRGKGFFASLTGFMSSGALVATILEGENAIKKNREIMGATNPKEASPGTIRRDFATDIENNVVHGSDAPETARWEIRFFFSELESMR